MTPSTNTGRQISRTPASKKRQQCNFHSVICSHTYKYLEIISLSYTNCSWNTGMAEQARLPQTEVGLALQVVSGQLFQRCSRQL